MTQQEQLAQVYRESLNPNDVFLVFLAIEVLRCQEGSVENLSNDDIARTIEEQLMVAHKSVPSTGFISDVRYMIDHQEAMFFMVVCE